MIYAGIDVTKDKHDCFITDSDGLVLAEPFTITNNRSGFDDLFLRLISCSVDLSKIKSRTGSNRTLQR